MQLTHFPFHLPQPTYIFSLINTEDPDWAAVTNAANMPGYAAIKPICAAGADTGGVGDGLMKPLEDSLLHMVW